jgi:hypothetical protein
MKWHHSAPAATLDNLENEVEKTGASESVAIVAIIWGIAIIVAATQA